MKAQREKGEGEQLLHLTNELKEGKRMLSDETSRQLERIERASRNGKKVKDLFKILTHYPDLWLMAYANIYSNKGALTKGVTNNTLDGMAVDRIDNLIKTIKENRYSPTPVKRVYIPKPNGKKRPLGIPTGDDKLVQEVCRIVLDRIYEPIFKDTSHGFRSKRSCHTALTTIVKTWNGVKWIVDMDIKGYFNNIDHPILIKLLRKKIDDNKFVSIIKRILKAGYLEDWTYHSTYSGTPQGGIISPLLANIYLHELDTYVEKICNEFNGGKRVINPEYKSLESKIFRLRRKIVKNKETNDAKIILDKIRELDKRRKTLPCRNDGNFKRLNYIRYADDFLVGVIGSKADAKDIKDKIEAFVNAHLNLEIAKEKSGLKHSKEGTEYLGYTISIRKTDRERKYAMGVNKKTGKKKYGKRRTMSYTPYLSVPKSKITKFCTKHGYTKGNQSVHRNQLLHNSDLEIISQYNAELRGIANYYSLASKMHIRLIERYALGSVFKTLAVKHRTSVKEIRRRLKVGNEHILFYTLNGKKKALKVFKLKHRKRNFVKCEDQRPNTLPYQSRTELLDRLNANRCEYCGKSEGYFEVHHIRKLSDIKDGKQVWQKHMIARNRKTLVLCVECHHLLTAGKLPNWRKDLYAKVESAVH